MLDSTNKLYDILNNVISDKSTNHLIFMETPSQGSLAEKLKLFRTF